MDGNVLGLRDHPPARVEEGSRAVAALLDVRGEGGAYEDGAHLLGDRPKRASEHLELDIHALVTPPSRSRYGQRAISIPIPHPPRGEPRGGSLELDHGGAFHVEGGGRREDELGAGV